MIAETPHFLRHTDGTPIAYHSGEGKTPGVIFLCGYNSDMGGIKATALAAHCRNSGRAFTRFDYRGHGQSGGRFLDGTIGAWAQDAIAVLDHVAQGPQILVGSSMGGWLMLLAALARPARIAGLVGIAPAPDFVLRFWDRLTPGQREAMKASGVHRAPSQYSDAPYAFSYQLICEGREHLLLDKPIPLTCPVRILHGQQDPDVPWQLSLTLAERLASQDVVVQLIKSGDHRLSTSDDIARLTRTLDELLTPQ